MPKEPKNSHFYILCKKDYLLEDETNIFDGDTPNDILEHLKKENINISRRTLFYAIKNQKEIEDKYLIYKIDNE
ncbi:MAG: hypothetical protein IKN65_00240 [Clostridia bacterium]|nr:hypothetical protein [Bacilli bacterium]MBR3672712.1 hypothetical protein [Clostridia bacterium]MBR4671586.1 hypothetical protein [Bacilli bacterium]